MHLGEMQEMVPFSVKVWLNTSSHMMLASYKGSHLHSMCFTHWPSDKSKSTLVHKLQETLHSSICKSLILFQTCTAKTYKPSWVHEIWMISWWILRTKAPLWLAANIANADLAVELWFWEENETRLEKTASEWEWLQGSVSARKLTDNHNFRFDMPDKSNWLCRFKHTGSTLNSFGKPRINCDYWSPITVIDCHNFY